jgi:adenylate cyclase
MTFEELKAVVVEWYEADVGDARADKYLRRINAQQRLELAARCLIEEGGKAEVTE